MSKTIILTDSNSGITKKEAKKLNIELVPMPIFINGEEYFEDETITQEQFYEFLKQDADVKTSQPSQFSLEEIWINLLKKYDEIVYIPMSSGLSATCRNAQVIAENYKDKVFVVDNKRIAITQRESVNEAISLVKSGKSGKYIKEYLEKTKDNHSIYIVMGTLKYLKKGGRISPAAATLGAMLNVKPILSTKGENFEKFALCLSFSQAKKKVIQQFKNEIEKEFKKEYEQGKVVLSLAHTQNEKEALKFKDEVLKELPNLKFGTLDPLSISVSCHIGPGAVGVSISVNNYLD